MIRVRFSRMLLAGTLAVPVFAVLLFALAVPLSVPLVAAAAFAAKWDAFLAHYGTKIVNGATFAKDSARSGLGDSSLDAS